MTLNVAILGPETCAVSQLETCISRQETCVSAGQRGREDDWSNPASAAVHKENRREEVCAEALNFFFFSFLDHMLEERNGVRVLLTEPRTQNLFFIF